jgi:hypothetical protein
MSEPILLPLRSIVLAEELLAATDALRIVVADCYVRGVEEWTPRPWGWETVQGGRTIVNVDHHAEAPRFYRHVSSGNLAVEYLNAHGTDAHTAVVFNHTDCDSVIASAILCGLIEPAKRYQDAVIAADHTGERNEIADLLQALDPARDYAGSIRSLRRFEAGEPMEESVETRLGVRRRERALASSLVRAGAFEREGRVAVATLPFQERVSGEFLPPLLGDETWVIVSGTPMPGGGGLWENKIRLGLGAPAGFNLFAMGIGVAEPMFGGRWNAGSTKRAGGSVRTPREVALCLANLIEPKA